MIAARARVEWDEGGMKARKGIGSVDEARGGPTTDFEVLWNALRDRDASRAYAAFRELERRAAETPESFERFDELTAMLGARSAYARTRGFLLIVASAGWDEAGFVEGAFERMAALLHDEKPTVVRQCVQALPRLAQAKPQMAKRIVASLESVDAGGYRDSMQPLIAADVAEALAAARERAANGQSKGESE